MNINRNNYEEYFLLYADNELSPQAKHEVERFVKENPDLHEEFLMFKQVVLKPDNSIMMDKSMLRKEVSFINHDNYEERFIEYHDDELNAAEESEVLEFVGANKLQGEFALFARVKMQPEIVPFPAKYSLYRKEEERRVVPIRWWLAAAAIITGFGIWITASFMNNNNEGLNSAYTVLNTKVLKYDVAVKKEVEPKQTNVKGQTLSQPVQNTNQVVTTVVKKDQVNKDQQPAPDRIIAQNKKPEVINKQDQDQVVEVTPIKTIVDPVVSNNLPNRAVEVTPRTEPSNVIPAVYTGNDEDRSENYAFFNVTSEEFKKSKLGGFLKKVKRVIGRKLPFQNEKPTTEVAIN